VETHRSHGARPEVIFIGRRMIISTDAITAGKELPLVRYFNVLMLRHIKNI